jgi:hypothetical protein
MNNTRLACNEVRQTGVMLPMTENYKDHVFIMQPQQTKEEQSKRVQPISHVHNNSFMDQSKCKCKAYTSDHP